MAVQQFLLHEDASGYALFKVLEAEAVGLDLAALSKQIDDYSFFKSMVELQAFQKFSSAEEALEELKHVSLGQCSTGLESFLELNLQKGKKGNKGFSLGVWDSELGKNLNDKWACVAGANVKEMLRGCLLHFPHFVKAGKHVVNAAENLPKAQCGLAHCYSRDKMQLDPNRQDKPIMNTIAILDSLDKNINTFAMRVREWYGWHFPELVKILTDNITYCKVARVIRIKEHFCEAMTTEGKKEKLSEKGDELMQALTEACGSEEIAEEVLAAVKVSMGQDMVEMDMANIDNFALQVIELARMRSLLQDYLKRKMDVVSPNLTALIGEAVGARLISHAGSLTNLAKYPASTVQILGAEKALFRALKTKGNTPKYGLLYHSTFIGRAAAKNKGRISRYLANKCSIASRIDCFAERSTKVFGETLKQQCEDRLAFLTEGIKPRKNLDVMAEAMANAESEWATDAKMSKKRAAEGATEGAPEKKKKKKDKKESKEVAVKEGEEGGEPEKKKKKKEKKAC